MKFKALILNALFLAVFTTAISASAVPQANWQYVKLAWSAFEVPDGECTSGVFTLKSNGYYIDTRCEFIFQGLVSPEDMEKFRAEINGVLADIAQPLTCSDEVVEDYYPTFSIKMPRQAEKVVFKYGGQPTCRRSSADNTERLEQAVHFIRGKYIFGEGQED